MEKRKCPVCKEKVNGRRDKIFCSPTCKSFFQYEKRINEDKFYFLVDKQLKTNRKILKKYNKTGKTTVRREVLTNEGFNPNYFTHFWKNAQNDTYLFCYDYGFLKLKETGINNEEKLKYLIIEWQDYMKKESIN